MKHYPVQVLHSEFHCEWLPAYPGDPLERPGLYFFELACKDAHQLTDWMIQYSEDLQDWAIRENYWAYTQHRDEYSGHYFIKVVIKTKSAVRNFVLTFL